MWTGTGEKDDVIVPLEAVENAAHPLDDRLYFEHWYFDARLEDGHVIVGFIQTSELVRRKPGVELHVYKPDGEKLSIIKSYPDRDVTASATGCDVRVGENRCYSEYPAGGLPVHHLHLSEDGMEFDLTFHNELPGWKPGVGMARYNERDFFSWIVPAPKARVEGTVKFGETVLDARGTGYHDHNWGVGDMKRIIDHWYWGRIYAEDFTLLYACVMATSKYKLNTKPLMLAHEGEIILSTGELELDSGDPVFNEVGNRDYPSWLTIKVPGSLGLRLDVREVIDAHDFVADLPVARSGLVKPAVNRLLGRPGYFRFSSDFSLRVFRDGKSYDRAGTTLHEMVALR
jgi:hypothetical protein